MKKKLALSVFLIYLTSNAQVELSNKYNTQLIFPSAVTQKVLGDINAFAFGKEQTDPQILNLRFFGDTSDTSETNLQVITESGQIFDLHLAHVANPKKRTYVISEKMAVHSLAQKNKTTIKNDSAPPPIPNQEPSYVASKIVYTGNTAATTPARRNIYNYKLNAAPSNLYDIDRETYVMNKSKRMENSQPVYFLPRQKYSAKKHKIRLNLKSVYIDKEEIYINIELNNASNSIFTTGSLSLFLDAIPGAKYTISQITPIEALFVSGLEKTIPSRTSDDFTIVIPKMSIGHQKVIRVEIIEEGSSRILELNIGASLINNPIV